MNTQRIKQLQKKLTHPVLIKKKENLLYITGHSFDMRSEEYLLLTKNQVVGFGSGLEKIEWAKKVDRLKNVGKYVGRTKQLDIEYGFTYGEGAYLKYKLPGVKVKPQRSPVDEMRAVKEPEEIALVRKSMQIVQEVFKLVKKQLSLKVWTEQKLADFIQQKGLEFGAEDLSFPVIVASGAHAAIPHHVPGSKKLKARESIILDFGFKYKGYCSDFTRTVFLKSVPKKIADAYNQTEKAYHESMKLAGEGVKAEKLYDRAVDVLAEKKLDKYFIHSLGHGTGLEIHELPNLSPKSKDVLHNGMIFSIEPGVYFSRLGGIRIEDLVYLEQGKVKKFINVSTKLTDNIF